MTTEQYIDEPRPGNERQADVPFTQTDEGKAWSEQEIAHVEAIYNNPANRSGNAGQVMNWKAAHENNRADWEALFASGRSEQRIRAKLYYIADESKVQNARGGRRKDWTQKEIGLLREYTTDPANIDVRGRVQWDSLATDPRYEGIVRGHSAVHIRSAAARHGLVGKHARQDNRQVEQPQQVQQQAPAKQFGCNFCPECGASLVAFNAAKSIQQK